MADEKKKKLEEIRRRKAEMQKLLKSKESVMAPKTTQQSDPAKESSSSSKKVETMSTISESSTSSPSVSSNPSFRLTKRNSLFENKEKNAKLYEIHIKKINQSLRTSKSEHFLQGIYPDVKSDETQYKLPEEFEEEKRQEELLKQQADKKKNLNFARRASVGGAKELLKKINLIEMGKRKLKEGMKRIAEKNLFYSKNENQIKNYCDKNFNILNEALTSNDLYDICNTYYNEEEVDINISKRTLATHLCDLYDDQCNGRIVTALDWSPSQHDYFLSAFSGTDNFNQQSGLIQLWSLNNRKAPDSVINYQTELTSAIFYKDNPKVVIGGSVTGQIMFWDLKTGRHVPEQKSPLGIANENISHSYPIHCLSIVGKDNNLISISTDGVLCLWTLRNLSRPINRYVLNPHGIIEQDLDKDSLNEIGPLCIGTSVLSNNSFILGCDESDIYNIRVDEKNYDFIDSYKGSKGPVFCVAPHPPLPDNANKFSDLFLSCGADWTTKLWSMSQSEQPLLTFNQSKDYVYSAKWHPINPSIFATGDGSGYIDLYDLNRDLEIPTFRYDLKTAVNKLAWSYDGKKLAAGDINGHIAIFQSEKDVLNVKIEDINKFDKTIEDIKNNCELELEKKKKKK